MGSRWLNPDESEGGLEQKFYDFLSFPDYGGKTLVAKKCVEMAQTAFSLLKIAARDPIVRHGRGASKDDVTIEYTALRQNGQRVPVKRLKRNGAWGMPHAPRVN